MKSHKHEWHCGTEYEYLAFLLDHMKDRRNKIGKDERCTTEYLMLNMAYQEFMKMFFGLYPALDARPPFGSGRAFKLFKIVEAYSGGGWACSLCGAVKELKSKEVVK